MSLFKNGKKNKHKKEGNIEDIVLFNGIGEEVHLLNGKNGPMLIKKEDSSIWLQTGEEYCPDCHCLMQHKDGYWECAICKYSITDEESAEGEGCPSLESTYARDYDDYFSRMNLSDNKPACCEACGGPWPDCESSCKLFND